MVNREPQCFSKPEIRFRRFSPGIGEVLDRENRSVNVVMPVDQKQLHAGNIMVGRGSVEPRRSWGHSVGSTESRPTNSFNSRVKKAQCQTNGWCAWRIVNTGRSISRRSANGTTKAG